MDVSLDMTNLQQQKMVELPCENDEIVKIVSTDGVPLTLTVGAARYSATLRTMIIDAGRSVLTTPLELTNEHTQANVLQKLFDFMEYYALNPLTEDPNTYSGEDKEVTNTKLSDFDKNWLNYDSTWTAETYNFWEVAFQACDYLALFEIINVVCQAFADKLHDKTEAEIVELFGVTPDEMPTPEERSEIEKQHAFLKTD
jgi:hypothetical protein